VSKYIGAARPTAVNLFWALGRIKKIAERNKNKPVSRVKKIIFKETMKIFEEDKAICRNMAKYGAALIKNQDSLLTHCNAGALATADYGTALGVIYEAQKQNKKVKVYADETRPLLQGARLTAWELARHGIDVTLICDNMAASLLALGKVDKIFVGADRIARNGDAANKIGTYNLAILAKYHKIPFYVVAPISSFDFDIESGKHIPIEQRSAEEVRNFMGKNIAPKDVNVWNPAFDVTPNGLISAIITEKGIFRKPYAKTLKKLERFSRER